MRFTVALMLVMGFTASAQDGVVLINQERANAGGITIGDASGFPVTITEPGSYKLTSNLRVLKADTDAIQVLVDHVTIDLNGFTIFGPGRTVGNGIVNMRASHTTVRNGNITGMDHGLALSAHAVVEKIRASDNRIGISAALGSVIRDSAAPQNQTGISAGEGALLINNLVTLNSAVGVVVFCPSTIVGNAITSNSAADIQTISTGCTRANNSPLP